MLIPSKAKKITAKPGHEEGDVSQNTNMSFCSRYRETWESEPPLPPSQKKDAVVFINSNCETPSGRNQIVMGLQAQAGVRVDSMGRCLSDGAGILRGPEAKHAAFRK